MQIYTWGVRGSFPVTNKDMQVYGGNTTCFEVRAFNTPIIILDAGTGLYDLSQYLEPQGCAHLFISHVHLDHVLGLTMFAPLFNPKWTIHFYVPAGQTDILDKVFDGNLSPLTTKDLRCTWDIQELKDPITLGQVTLEFPRVPHTGVCHAFRISTSTGTFCVATDIEIDSPESYSLARQIFSGAHSVFVDAQFTASEYSRHKGWGHTAMDVLPGLATESGVQNLYLCHHAPFRTDVALEGILMHLREVNKHSKLHIDMAKENAIYSCTEVLPNHYADNHFNQWVMDFSQELLQYDDIGTVLDRILIESRKVSNADAGTIFLVENNELAFAFTHNDTLFPVDMAHKYSYANARLPIDAKSIAGYCATTRAPLLLDDVRKIPQHLPFKFNDSFDRTTHYHTSSMLCLPLIGKGNSVLGVIQLINCLEKGVPIPFSPSTLRLLTMLSVQAVNSIERSLMAKEMIHRMQLMASMIDPQETGHHVERVGAIAAEIYQVIAKKQGLDLDTRRITRSQIRLAAMLHDLGKVAIPHEILKKPSKLTQEEYTIMQTHCVAGANLFLHASELVDVMAKTIALHHHQKWNGKGYTGTPHVPILAGEDIPLPARITAVADVFDALISNRCYKPAWAWEDAIATIRNESGEHFDPQVVEAFLEVESVIKSIYTRYQEA